MRRRSLLMLLSLLPVTCAAMPTADAAAASNPEAAPAFELRNAAVRAAPPAADPSAPYAITARVLPRAAEAAAFDLQARVQSKGIPLDCNPDTVFRNGFES